LTVHSIRSPGHGAGHVPVRRVSVAIVGTGFAGLGLAIQLKQAGIHDILLLEKAAAIGGAWRDNVYPGCACDIPSHLYSFSFEPNPDWTRVYAPQAEIRSYLERCADRYDIRRHVELETEVVAGRFDEARGSWQIETSRGERLEATVFIMATGALSRPAIPSIRGLDRFTGHRFHSATWDHAAPLDGARVAVIGTGASAIQFVPRIAPRVAQLDLYQRTPPWIMPREDRAFTATERRRFAASALVRQAHRLAIYGKHELRFFAFSGHPRLLALAQKLAGGHLRKSVADPALRARLTPDYAIGCKRVLISDDYYPALQRDNVAVVTDAIREVTATGVVTADGVERRADAIIFGTGFAVHDYFGRIEITGRGGLRLADAWRDRAEAYLGTVVAGFPNLFTMTGPNTGLGHNSMIFMIESQIRYIVDCLRYQRARGIPWVDIRSDVQRRYNDELQARLGRATWQTGGCQSWYLDHNGVNTALWPGFTVEYAARTRRFDPAAYHLGTPPAATDSDRSSGESDSPAVRRASGA
jgi:cation diffusion facilitator CzcD-associated flavoprotein CzcO